MKYNLNIKVNNNLSDLLIGYSCQGWLDNNAKVYNSVLVDKDNLVSDGDDYKAVVEIDINNTVVNGKTYKFNMQCAKCNNKEGVKVLWYVIPTNDASVYSEDDRMFFKNNVAEDASTGSYVIPKVNIDPFRFIQELYVEAPIKSMRLYNPNSFGTAGQTFTVVRVQYKLKNDNTTYHTERNHIFTIETDTNYAVCNDFENDELMCNSNVITSFNPSAENSFDDPDTYDHPNTILIQKQNDDDLLYLKPNAIVIDFVPFKTMFPSIESEEPDSYGVLVGKFNDKGTYAGYIKETDYNSLTTVTGSSYPKKYEDSVNHITVYFKTSNAPLTEETRRGYVCNSAQSWQYKLKGYNGNSMYDFSSLDTLPQYPLVNCLNGTVKPCIKQVASTTNYITDIVGPKDDNHMKHYIYGYSGSVEAKKYNRW